MPENSQYIRNLTMTSKFLAADFVPDGDLSKKVWKEAAPHYVGSRPLRAHPPSLILKCRWQASGPPVTCTSPTSADIDP